MELAVEAVYPWSRIVRIGDVVPPVEDMATNWRRNHWLPIMFSCGRNAFDYIPEDYTVWLSRTDELARNVAQVASLGYGHSGRYHLLGNRYSLRKFREYVDDGRSKSLILAQWISEKILHAPEASMVSQSITEKMYHFDWTTLDANYWKAFAERSIQR